MRLEASEADISGKLVIEAKDLAISFGERVIVKNFSTRIPRGDRLGLIGANGAGKTTLVNLLTGTLALGLGSGMAPILCWQRSTRAARASILKRS